MEIPYKELSDEALINLITDFVSSTDDGGFDMSLSDKIDQVKQLLFRGLCSVTFNEDTGSCTISKQS